MMVLNIENSCNLQHIPQRSRRKEFQMSDNNEIYNTTSNDLVMRGKQDSPRIQFLKAKLPLLTKQISSTKPSVSVITLRAELREFLKFFREIFNGNKPAEKLVLQISIRELSTSGRAHLLSTITECGEIDDELKRVMIKFILDEVP
jgi:hypothetical protein